MDWTEDVQARLKRKNQVLFAKNSPFLQDLSALIAKQPHRALVLWALELAEETAAALCETYPRDARPQTAVQTARAWAAGRAKMPAAQRAILDVHAMAKGLASPEDIALCHAVGQACGVVHTPGHAIGYPVYELTALVRRHGPGCFKGPVERRKTEYMARLSYWGEHFQTAPLTWADFLMKD